MAVVSTVELFLSAAWNKRYYSSGVTLFERRLPTEPHQDAPPKEYLFESHCRSSWMPPLVFKALETHAYAFRERLLQISGLRCSYFPLMRGLVLFDRGRREVVVKGFANLSAMALPPVVLLQFLGQPSEPLFVLLLLALMIAFFGYVYWIQARRFADVAAFAFRAWSWTPPSSAQEGSRRTHR
jgi:hypothetical protein